MTSRIDTLVSDLCEEIDTWKQEAKYWKEKYKESHADHMKLLNENLEYNQIMIGSILSIAFNSSEDENGNLVIDRSGRENIVDHIKGQES